MDGLGSGEPCRAAARPSTSLSPKLRISALIKCSQFPVGAKKVKKTGREAAWAWGWLGGPGAGCPVPSLHPFAGMSLPRTSLRPGTCSRWSGPFTRTGTASSCGSWGPAPPSTASSTCGRRRRWVPARAPGFSGEGDAAGLRLRSEPGEHLELPGCWVLTINHRPGGAGPAPVPMGMSVGVLLWILE